MKPSEVVEIVEEMMGPGELDEFAKDFEKLKDNWEGFPSHQSVERFGELLGKYLADEPDL